MAPKNEQYINQTLLALAKLSLANQPFTTAQLHEKSQGGGFQGDITATGDSLRALRRWPDFGLERLGRNLYQALPCYQWRCLPDPDWLIYAYNNCKAPTKYPDRPKDLGTAGLALLKASLSQLCTQECAASRLKISTSDLNSMLRGKKPMPTSVYLALISIIHHLTAFFNKD